MQSTQEIETYVTRPSTSGRSIFYYTSICHNRMFCISYEPKRWDRCYCPKCGRVLEFDKELITQGGE